MPRRPSEPSGVGWEMIVRWKLTERYWLEIRALSRDEVEVRCAGPGTDVSKVIPFGDLRQALDELERSAREIEKL